MQRIINEYPRNVVEQLPFWHLLTEDEKTIIASTSLVKRCDEGEILHGNCDGGGSCLGLVHVLRGELKVSLFSKEGREITLLRLEKGETNIFAAHCVMAFISLDTQMSVSRDADLLIIPVSQIAGLTENNVNVRCFMYEMASLRLSSALWIMQQIMFVRFDQRLAGFLLEEYERTGHKEIRMTQEKIAERVNSAREVVTRTLRQFASEGLIESRRGVISILDADGLRLMKYQGVYRQ